MKLTEHEKHLARIGRAGRASIHEGTVGVTLLSMPNVTLVVSAGELKPKLEVQAGLGDNLLAMPRSTNSDIIEFKRAYHEWDGYNQALLESSFDASGWMTVTPASDYSAAGFQIVDLKLTQSTPGFPVDRIESVVDVIRAKVGILRSIGKRLDVYPTKEQAAAERQVGATGEAIFIVHGHALLTREEVRRFLERATSRQVVVLEDEPNQGQDVLGKLLSSAKQAAYAVVLLTPDDEGRVAGVGEWKPRARQNVVLELGLFLGLLGRNKVAALYDPSVEIPSDFSGVVYIKLDDGGWKMKLGTELKAAGIEVDLNRAI